MKPSPLLLEGTFLEEVSFLANPEYSKDGNSEYPSDWDKAFGDWGLASNVAVSKASDNPERYGVRLLVNLGKSDAEVESPYTIKIVMVGMFSVRDNINITDKLKFVYANGAAVLYGAIRDLVFTLSSRGPSFPLLLPAVMFLPPDSVKEPEAGIVQPDKEKPA